MSVKTNKYQKDGSVSRGSDCGWVKDISFTKKLFPVYEVRSFFRASYAGLFFFPKLRRIINKTYNQTFKLSIIQSVQKIIFSNHSRCTNGK